MIRRKYIDLENFMGCLRAILLGVDLLNQTSSWVRYASACRTTTCGVGPQRFQCLNSSHPIRLTKKKAGKDLSRRGSVVLARKKHEYCGRVHWYALNRGATG